MQSCFVFSLSHSPEQLKDGWKGSLHVPLTPGNSSKRPLFKGTIHHQRLQNNLKKSVTSNKNVMKCKGPIPGMTHAQALTTIQTMADHSQKWHDDSCGKNISSSSNSDGIATIVSKLDNLDRDMKKLKENVHAIQVGCQLCGGPHLYKECPLNEETKSMEEVKYEEFRRPFPNNNRINERFGRGAFGYGSRSIDQPSLGERKPNLTKTINKYMEEMAKRHAKQDEWLKKLYLNTRTSRENHDKVIRSLETKVKTLTSEVEGRTNKAKFKECKAIYMEDGTPLYTPF
ncbi:hypothetical protein Tco_0484439 [Tanacetum coccineum]